ncbi:hypothetical protein [Sulfolobus acidocaldarius]|uniref:hypothetical protein n=1 Tax=Sulfolobus acidocaldarius TaxID=2285 RepID=UPI001E64CCA7|nr:hypothetical protein [Sulfolobus acidocaldarius]
MDVLRGYPNYIVQIEGNNVTIDYVPPSISEASGVDVDEDTKPIIRIWGIIDGEKLKILKASVIKGEESRDLDESEIQFWLSYVDQGGWLIFRIFLSMVH